MADKNLTCSDCGMEFEFTEREQAFYAEKGFCGAPPLPLVPRQPQGRALGWRQRLRRWQLVRERRRL